MLDQLQASDFSPWLNHTFTLRFSPEVSLPAELVQVSELPKFVNIEISVIAVI